VAAAKNQPFNLRLKNPWPQKIAKGTKSCLETIIGKNRRHTAKQARSLMGKSKIGQLFCQLILCLLRFFAAKMAWP
jgi:hypothetical protein